MIVTITNEEFGCSESMTIPDDAEKEAIGLAAQSMYLCLFLSVAAEVDKRFEREIVRQEAEDEAAEAAIRARRAQFRLVRNVA